jgi:hypothetical protein
VVGRDDGCHRYDGRDHTAFNLPYGGRRVRATGS